MRVRRKTDRITYLLGIYVGRALCKDAAIKNHEAPKQRSINCDERVRSTCEQTQLFQRDLCYFDHQAPSGNCKSESIIKFQSKPKNFLFQPASNAMRSWQSKCLSISGGDGDDLSKVQWKK